MTFAVINGVRLRYEREGQGQGQGHADRVVLVHGSWGDHESWRGLVPLLATDHDVVTYDRRGHSSSEAPPGQGSIHEDVNDVVGLIDHLGGQPVHLVGTSSGATIALRVAAQHPDRIRTVAANEPDVFGVLGPGDRRVEALEDEVRPVVDLLTRGNNEEAVRLFVETVTFGPGAWERLPPEARRRLTTNAPTFLDQKRDPDWGTVDLDRLAASPAPLLLLHGDQTRPAFAAVVEALAARLPRATVAVLEGAGHASAATHPGPFASALREFWRSTSL